MQVLRFDAHLGQSGQLLGGAESHTHGRTDDRLELFMEQLRARVGEAHLRRMDAVAEHCPEYACAHYDPHRQAAGRQAAPATADNPRPFWLLPQPQPLTVRRGRLYHRRPLTLLSGPERIETRWWSGTDVRRDYYVASEEDGSRLRVFREKTGERGWYLHGFFA
jgi:protein ImuB